MKNDPTDHVGRGEVPRTYQSDVAVQLKISELKRVRNTIGRGVRFMVLRHSILGKGKHTLEEELT